MSRSPRCRRAPSARSGASLGALRRAAFRAAGACLALLCETGTTSRAAAQPRPASTSERVLRVIASVSADVEAGVFVADAASGAALVEWRSDSPLKPASTLKLFVAAAALARFGPEFTFDTEVYRADDELWVRGGGDPGLGDDRLARRQGGTVMSVFGEWAEALRAGGVASIGTLVVDDGVFDFEFRHPDWPDEQSQRWYAAPVGGLNFNDNCLDVRIVMEGGRPVLRVTPPLPPELLSDELRPGRRHRPVSRREPGSDIFRVSGSVSRADELGPVSANNPTLFSAYALKQALAERGIVVRGDVVRRRLAPEALASSTLLARHRTALRDVIWRANNFSQNLFAECMLKALAAYEPDGRRGGVAGSWSGGVAVLVETLRGLGVDLGGAVIRDGSGLSHSNRVTARQLGSLLCVMRRHPHSAVFIDSLAAPGRDGTLRRRFVGLPGSDRLRLKTGTLRDSSSVAGYFDRSDGTTLALAVIACGPEAAARRFTDAVVEALLYEDRAAR